MKKTKISAYQQQKIDEYLEKFKRESEDIRELIVDVIPAYNKLLSLHALTFEEFALLPLAREQGLAYKDPLFSYEDIKIPCAKCGETKKVNRVGDNQYRCYSCGKRFPANANSISSGANTSSVTWMQVLLCILNFYGLNKTCKICNISPTTYYLIRNRIFYGMHLMMEEVKLYGKIQVDNTFIHLNYKGTDLLEKEYPENSPFDSPTFIPREARKRGGYYTNKNKNLNAVCIFTGIDEYGHIFARYTGIGAATSSRLKKVIPEEKILSAIPEKDPFEYNPNSTTKDENSSKETLIISDKEAAIKKFALDRGYNFESHVYRRNSVQCRLSKTSSNIQRVNNLHKKLKDFLRNSNYVSTKYLPGYLTLFEFINNTGASNEAIGYLFEILAKPGLGKPKEFYNNMFSIPNYIAEAMQDGKLLDRFPYVKLQAAYLYEKHIRKDLIEGKEVLVKDIIAETGYSAKTIRRLHHNFSSSGVIPEIIAYFEHESLTLPKKISQNNRIRNSITPEMLYAYDKCYEHKIAVDFDSRCHKKFIDSLNKELGMNYTESNWNDLFKKVQKSGLRPPMPVYKKKWDSKTMFEIYDKFCKFRELPFTQRSSISVFFEQINKKYGYQYSTQRWRYIMNEISASGQRPPLPPMKNKRQSIEGNDNAMNIAYDLLERAEEIKRSYEKQKIKTPTTAELSKLLAEETGLTTGLVKEYIIAAKKCRKDSFLKNLEYKT